MQLIEERSTMTPVEVGAITGAIGAAVGAVPAFLLFRANKGKIDADSYKTRAEGASVLVLASEEAVGTIRALLGDLRTEVDDAKKEATRARALAVEARIDAEATKAELSRVSASLTAETHRCNRLEERIVELENAAPAATVTTSTTTSTTTPIPPPT